MRSWETNSTWVKARNYRIVERTIVDGGSGESSGVFLKSVDFGDRKTWIQILNCQFTSDLASCNCHNYRLRFYL